MNSLARSAAAVVMAGTALTLQTAGFAQGAGQQFPPFEFRGHRVGDAFEAVYPGQNARSLPCISLDTEPTVGCVEKGFGSYGDGEVGAVPVTLMLVNFWKGRLSGVSFNFQSASYFKLKDMLTGKYGPPNSEPTKVLQNRMGAEFPSETSIWKFAEGDLSLRQHTGSLTSGELIFLTTSVQAEKAQMRSSANQAAGRSAF